VINLQAHSATERCIAHDVGCVQESLGRVCICNDEDEYPEMRMFIDMTRSRGGEKPAPKSHTIREESII
jgi:hypothetical protein